MKRLCIILFDCTVLGRHFDLLWSSLTTKVVYSNPTGVVAMSDFLVDLEQHQKALLSIGCLPVPFDRVTIRMITPYVASATGKIYKLREREIPSITK